MFLVLLVARNKITTYTRYTKELFSVTHPVSNGYFIIFLLFYFATVAATEKWELCPLLRLACSTIWTFLYNICHNFDAKEVGGNVAWYNFAARLSSFHNAVEQ